MKTVKTSLLIALLALLFTGCMRNDTQVKTFHVVQVSDAASQRALLQSLRPLKGIESVNADLAAQTIEVRYDARRLHLKNIEAAISAGGFDLPNRPATAESKRKLAEALNK